MRGLEIRGLAVGLVMAAALWAQGRYERDLVYGRAAGVDLKLDAFIPEGPGPHRAVIIVHGGGWEAGDKAHEWIRPIFAPLEAAGFAWFSIDYRLAPAHRWPACHDDVRTAVRWIREHARQFRVDPDRIAIAGESAGGHLVNWIGVDRDSAVRVRAVVSLYGISDFVSRYEAQGRVLAPNVRRLIGLEREAPVDSGAMERLRDASPIHHVRGGMPPFLFIHGTEDRGVPVQQSSGMCERMRAAGSRCEVMLVPGAGHGISSWEGRPEFLGYKSRMIEWLKREIP